MAALQRTYLRRAVVDLLQADAWLNSQLASPVVANRIDPAFVTELPVLGVYILKETPLPDTQSPPKNERRAELVLQFITRYDQVADDFIDEVCAHLESLIWLPDISARIVTAGGQDTLLEIFPPSFEMVLADEDGSDTAVAFLQFNVDYAQPDIRALPVLGNFAEMDSQITDADRRGQIDGHIDLPGPYPTVP